MNANLRNLVLIRDNRTCQLCNEEKEKLDVHHIIPRKREGRDDFNNLITLCHPCHMKMDVRKPKPRSIHGKTIISFNLYDDIIEQIDKQKEEYWTRSGFMNMFLREKLLK